MNTQVTDPDEWAAEFTKWLSNQCAVSARFSTNVAALYRDFGVWCVVRNDWPCDSAAFMSLLGQAGFTLSRVHGAILVHRLGLVEDVEYMKATYGGTKASKAA